MKFLFGLTLSAAVAVVTLGQTPSASSAISKCTLTRAQSPEIRGIRLGMTTEQLVSRFPDEENRRRINDAIIAGKRPESYGVAGIELRADRQSTNPRFAGVNVITVWLLDERVTSFSVQYAGTAWTNAAQFAAKLSEGLPLPAASWEVNQQWSSMTCDGFKVEAFASTGSETSMVRVVDPSAPQIVAERREAEKERARQAFKP